MASQLGPIEIDCDAPSYAIVRACHRVGVRTPEDVPWYRFGHFVNGHGGRKAVPGLRDLFSRLLGHRPRRTDCSCGRPLPEPALCMFFLASGGQESYLIGQCERCRTVYWDEAPSPPAG